MSFVGADFTDGKTSYEDTRSNSVLSLVAFWSKLFTVSSQFTTPVRCLQKEMATYRH